MILKDWTPVQNPVLYPVTHRQAVPAWNPPPTVWGIALKRHTGSGHLPPPPPPPPPAISSITPNNGPEGGGTSSAVLGAAGTDMRELTGITYGGEAGALGGGNITQRIAISPPGNGLVNVTVTGPGGTSNPVQFQYNAP